MVKKSKVIKIVDLFAGIGGIRIGCERAAASLGFRTECVFTSESDFACRETYKNYFGYTEINEDITYLKDKDIKKIQSKTPTLPINCASLKLDLPFANPTRIEIAIESPIGIIKVNDATFIAI